MNITSILSMGVPKLLNRTLFIVVSGFTMLCLWCVYKVWATPIPGPILPAKSSMTPLVVENQVVNVNRDIITERPLFWRGRKPVITEPDTKIVKVDDRSGDLFKVKVLGVYPDGAMISGVKGKTRVSVGDKIFGWTLGRVTSSELRFLRNGRYESLYLPDPSAPLNDALFGQKEMQ